MPRRGRSNNKNIILLFIVLVFFVCHILRFFSLAYYSSLVDFAENCMQNVCNTTDGNVTMIIEPPDIHYPLWLWKANPVGAFLLLLNSSINFIIYVLAGSRFRATFFRKFPCIFRHFRHESTESNEIAMGEMSTPVNRSKLIEQT